MRMRISLGKGQGEGDGGVGGVLKWLYLSGAWAVLPLFSPRALK